MSIFGTLFGYVKVRMFVQTEYLGEFIKRILAIGISDVNPHKTTEDEAKLVRIKNRGIYTTVVVTVSKKKIKNLSKVKSEFDRFVSDNKARKIEEAKELKRKAAQKKKKKPTKSDSDRDKLAVKLRKGSGGRHRYFA